MTVRRAQHVGIVAAWREEQARRKEEIAREKERVAAEVRCAFTRAILGRSARARRLTCHLPYLAGARARGGARSDASRGGGGGGASHQGGRGGGEC